MCCWRHQASESARGVSRSEFRRGMRAAHRSHAAPSPNKPKTSIEATPSRALADSSSDTTAPWPNFRQDTKLLSFLRRCFEFGHVFWRVYRSILNFACALAGGNLSSARTLVRASSNGRRSNAGTPNSAKTASNHRGRPSRLLRNTVASVEVFQ